MCSVFQCHWSCLMCPCAAETECDLAAVLPTSLTNHSPLHPPPPQAATPTPVTNPDPPHQPLPPHQPPPLHQSHPVPSSHPHFLAHLSSLPPPPAPLPSPSQGIHWKILSCALQDGHQVIGDSHEHVVILFSDIVGFSTMAATMSAVEVFLMLSNLYYAFDRLVDKFGIYKVETIGDGYMLAAGNPFFLFFLPAYSC